MNNKEYEKIEKHYNKLVKNKTIKTLNDALIYKKAIDKAFSLFDVGCSLKTKSDELCKYYISSESNVSEYEVILSGTNKLMFKGNLSDCYSWIKLDEIGCF